MCLYLARQVVEWFWGILGEWNTSQHARLLHFATGTSQVPIGGFANLQGHLGERRNFELKLVSLSGQDSPWQRFPRGHTCFNRIDLPEYTTRNDMKESMEAVLNIDFAHTQFGME